MIQQRKMNYQHSENSGSSNSNAIVPEEEAEERTEWGKNELKPYGTKNKFLKVNKKETQEEALMNNYESDLLTFFNDYKSRFMHHTTVVSSVLSNKLNTKLGCQYCREHDSLGDWICYRKGTMYKRCGICVKPKKESQKQEVERIKESALTSNYLEAKKMKGNRSN
jgi:hypothetical protein